MKHGFLRNIAMSTLVAGCVAVGLAGCAKDNPEDGQGTELAQQTSVSGETATASQQTATGGESSSTGAEGSTETRYSVSETSGIYDVDPTTDLGNGSGVVEEGSYTSMAEVSEYLHEFGHLPDNYITKNEAKKLGWVASEGNLTIVAPGKSIGGDKFGNREGLLPKKKGRQYYECDIDYTGGERNGKRLVYSDDGLIYYTEDHYNSFTQVY